MIGPSCDLLLCHGHMQEQMDIDPTAAVRGHMQERTGVTTCYHVGDEAKSSACYGHHAILTHPMAH